MKRPPDVNPADFEAAMRPEAADPWEPLPHDAGWWLMSLTYGWLGPFPSTSAARERADRLDYLDDWQEVKINTLSAPIYGYPL